MENISIRQMNADHLDAVTELEKLSFSVPWSRKMLSEELENDCAAFLVAENADGALLGYAGLLVVLDEGYITNVAVHPDYRQKGVATQLLRVFVDFARANHLAFLTLEVRPSNTAAIVLYGRQGFRSMGRRKNYYEHPKEDAIIMTLELKNGNETSDTGGTAPGL